MYHRPYYHPHWHHPVHTHPWSYNWNPYYNNWNNNYWNSNGDWHPNDERHKMKDFGSRPFVVNIRKVTKQNNTFRTALWTGKYLQLTLMSIGVGEDIGLESHPNLDQFIRIEEGQGLVQMGDSKYHLDFEAKASSDDVILIPAGKWHNLINTGNRPLKLYSIYAPPEHPYGTIHETKAIALANEENHHY